MLGDRARAAQQGLDQTQEVIPNGTGAPWPVRPSMMVGMSLSPRTEIFKPALHSASGMAVAQNARAARVGAAILETGGNAADAAVAVSFALGILEPWMSGIGGGGAALFRDAHAGKVYSIDFGLRAPSRFRHGAYMLSEGRSRELFPWRGVEGDRNANGIDAVAIPAMVAGMAAIHQHFGHMPWRELIIPAIDEAKAGLDIDWYSAQVIASNMARLTHPAIAAQFLPDGLPPQVLDIALGKRMPMPQLADTLSTLADEGPESFRTGNLAATFAHEIAELGGTIDAADLAAVAPEIAEAASVPFRGSEVFLSPGLTSGRTLGRTLALMEADTRGRPATSMRDWYAAMAASLTEAQAERWANDGDVRQADCTTHFATADASGSLCSVTQTILSAFGSGVMTPRTGIILNNGMLWFDPESGRPNSIAPGKRCLMNVCPTILRQGERFTAIGAAGGRRILSAVTQVTGFLVDHGMTLEEAMHHPRIDCSIAGTVQANPLLADLLDGAFPGAVSHRPPHGPWPVLYSIVNALAVEAGGATGCADPMSPWADVAVANE
jgi:gamma-glutamyltranspeptidase/glutathione hydrolase